MNTYYSIVDTIVLYCKVLSDIKTKQISEQNSIQ